MPKCIYGIKIQFRILFREKKEIVKVSAPMYLLYEGTIKSTIQKTPVHTTTAARCRMSPEHNYLAEKKKRRKKSP